MKFYHKTHSQKKEMTMSSLSQTFTFSSMISIGCLLMAMLGSSWGAKACRSDGAATYLFDSCPPSRRFEPMGNQSLLGTISATGVAQDWWCGRHSGLRLRNDKPQILYSNMTSFSGNRLSLNLQFRPGNTSLQVLKTLMSLISFKAYDNDFDGCNGNLLQVGQYGSKMLLRYRDSLSNCRVLLLRDTQLSTKSIDNFLLETNETDLVVFMNDTLISRSTGLDLSGIKDSKPPCEVLLLGSLDVDVDYFDGSIHRLCFSNESCSESVTEANETSLDDSCDYQVYEIAHVTEPEALVLPQGSNVSHILSIPVQDETQVEIQLRSLPTKGVVVLDGEEAQVGSNFSLSTSIAYTVVDLHFFNTPRINAHGVDNELSPENFTYVLRSFDDDGFLVAESREILFSIHVQLVNHVPQLLPPDKVTPSGNTWTISGVQLLDPQDRDMNLVRVDVSSRRGRMTVSCEEARLVLARYECSGRSASAWQCSGDGFQDRRLIFVATPSDATYVLGSLLYESLSPVRPEADNVTIVVYDGLDGDCLSQTEHWLYQEALGNHYPSLHPDGCVSVQLTISIPGFTEDSSGGYSLNGGSDSRSFLPDLIFWTMFSATLCCFCRSRFKKCAQRGTAVGADGDEEIATPERPNRFRAFPPGELFTSSVNWDEIVLT